MTNLPENLVYEFVVGDGIWEVFSTKEWENFATNFCSKHHTNSLKENGDVIKIEKVDKTLDGRKRLKVLLPGIEWLRKCTHEKHLKGLQIKPIGKNFHVPKYLDVMLMMAFIEQNESQTIVDGPMNPDTYGSAKLVYISKPKKSFTVIIYGV